MKGFMNFKRRDEILVNLKDLYSKHDLYRLGVYLDPNQRQVHENSITIQVVCKEWDGEETFRKCVKVL